MLKLLFDRDRMYPYPFYMADLALTADMEPIIGENLSMSFTVFENGHLSEYYDVDSMDRLGSLALDRILKDDVFRRQALDEIKTRSQGMEDFSLKLMSLDVGRLKNQELIDLYAEYVGLTRSLRAWGWIPPLIDGANRPFLSDLIDDKFRSFLKAKGLEHKLAEYYSLLSTNESPSEVQQEELARLELLAAIQGHPESKDELIQKHLDDYGWLTYAYSGPAMTREQLDRSLRSLLDEGDIFGQIQRFHQRYADIKRQKEELLVQLGLPDDLKRLLEISTQFMAIKDYRKGVYQRSYLAMDNVMSEIAKRLGLDLKGVKHLIYEEVRQALTNQKPDNLKDLVGLREKKCCLLIRRGEAQIFQGQECEDMIRQRLGDIQNQQEISDVKELKGSVAYAGKVRGTAKVVLVPEDVDKVEEGDILVSSATNPDLIVAMKRAAAFVTDTGGITSHASIVARELMKPCVVGTGRATKIIKDGMELEVDAEKGLITIIKN